MSGLFPHREHTDPWFRIGRLDVTTVMFVVLAVVISWLAWAFVPNWSGILAYSPGNLVSAQIWRLITWPFAGGLSLFGALNLFFFWYFGSELEGQIGRRQMAGLLVGVWASITVAYSLMALLFTTQTFLAGIGLIEFLVLLLWIADNPTRRFWFNIPAWAFGLVILGIDVLQMVAYGMYVDLLALLLSLVFVAIAARRSGLLGQYAWIPGAPNRRPKAPKVPRSQVRTQQRRASDQERMDALLDQISEHGLQSLTPAQRKELKALSDRRRKG